jgi:predicted glycoside hydrolase/deacetylase ChbG (UPF0249 family)
MRKLIIIGDDLGLAAAVDRSLLASCAARLISAPAWMPTSAQAIHLLAKLRALGRKAVGLHLTLSEVTQRPLTAEFAELCSRSGSFLDRETTVAKLNKLDAAEARALRSELRAQVDSVDAAGLRIAHISSHQHLHVLPCVADALAAVLRERKVESCWVRGYGDDVGPPSAKAYSLLQAHAAEATRFYRAQHLDVTCTVGFHTLSAPSAMALQTELDNVRHAEHPVEWMVHPADYAAGEPELGLARQAEYALLREVTGAGGLLATAGLELHEFEDA